MPKVQRRTVQQYGTHWFSVHSMQRFRGEFTNNSNKKRLRNFTLNFTQDSKCNSEGNILKASQCAAPTSSNSYCYVKAVGMNLQRGCALSVKEQQSCLGDDDCSLCLPENAPYLGACNNYNLNFKSGAAQGQQLFGPLLGFLTLVALRVLQ